MLMVMKVHLVMRGWLEYSKYGLGTVTVCGDTPAEGKLHEPASSPVRQYASTSLLPPHDEIRIIRTLIGYHSISLTGLVVSALAWPVGQRLATEAKAA